MGKRKIGVITWYRSLFLNERTATVTAILALVIMPLVSYFDFRAGEFNLASTYNLAIRFILVITLLRSIRAHRLLLMQAATVGLMLCMLCAQAQYALGDLWRMDSETYITMGLQGFIFLAVEQMILVVQSLVCFNHFAICIARRQGLTRLFVNRAAILLLLALLAVQLIIAPMLSFDLAYILHIWTLHLDELLVFALLMCAELILVLDSQELGEG